MKLSDRCGNTQTLLHILSYCCVALEQGRYTWHDDSVLSYIVRLICPKIALKSRLFSDLPAFHAPGGGSIPPHVLTTTSRPDICIVNEMLRGHFI